MNLEANNMDEIVALIMKELKKTDIKAGCQSCESPKMEFSLQWMKLLQLQKKLRRYYLARD